MNDILLLALSTLRIDKNSHEVAQSTLIYEGKKIGVYHYQLEPILHLYKSRNEKPETIIYLYTDKTDKEMKFVIDEKSYSCSARKYFEQKVHEMFVDVEVGVLPIKMIPIKVTDDVSTIKDVINALREKYSGNPEDMQLTMDIHGAFRDTQMILQNIITLLRFEDIIPKDIYTVKYTDSTGTIEKVDEINDVNEFVSAMNEFLTYGRSKTLESYVNKTNQNTDLAALIKDISDSIQLCNVRLFDESIKSMAEFVKNYPEKGMGNYNDIFIDSIKASYGELMDEKKRSMVANKVKWCVDHDFIQQALTLIESDALEDLYNRNIIKFHYDYPKEKSMKLIDKRDLSHVDNEYIDGALNGGDTLRKTYEDKIRQSIENGEFTNDEEGLRKYVETIQHYQKNIAIPVEDNKQKQELQEMGLPTYDMNPDLSEQTAFANDQFTDFNKMISMQMLGRVDEDFINFLGSANIISDTDISKENREQYIEHFSEGIIGQEEQQQAIDGDMTVEQLFNQYGLENVKMDDLKRALEDIKQRQNPIQERINPLANEKNSEGREL